MADFMRIKYENQNLKQFELANQLSYSSSTLRRYNNDVNMVSPYRIQPNNTSKRTKETSIANFDNNSHREPDVKRFQMISNDLITTQTTRKSNRKIKNILKAGRMQENIEINEHYLHEILDNNDL